MSLEGDIYRLVEESNQVRDMNKWHASSLAECPRALYFKRKGIKALETPGAGKMLRWEAGHVIEKNLQPYLKQIYPDILFNQRLENDIFTGEYDCYVPSLKKIIEIKSVHDWAMRQKDKKPILRDDSPYLNHELQNHGYVKLMREKNIDVEEITYLYITLGGLMVSYTTPIKKKILRSVEARLKTLEEAVKTDTPPECLCREDHPLWGSTTQYCNYRTKTDCCNLKLLEGTSDK